MNLIKGMLLIAVLGIFLTSCEQAKKAKDNTADGVENVTGDKEEVIDFCCTNHSPRHCATTLDDMAELTSNRGCSFE